MARFKIPTGVKIFACLWLLILVLPKTREVFQAYSAIQAFSNGGVAIPYSTANRLLEKFPDSIPMVIWVAEQDYMRGERKPSLKRLDALYKQFPQHQEILASQLILLASDTRPNKKPFPELMNRAAKIASEGGAHEPENTFWPMMEAGFLFSSGQNEAAIKALQKAKVGTRYNDFSQKILRERIHFCEQHESIVWEQKMVIWASTSYPQIGLMRETAKSATAEAISARKRGDHQRALTIINPLLNASRLIRRDSQVIISSIVSEAMARESLQKFLGVNALKSDATEEAKALFRKTLVSKLTRYAAENGSPESSKLVQFIQEKPLRMQFWDSDPYGWIGLPNPYNFLAIICVPLLCGLSFISLAGSFIWLVHALIFRHENEAANSVRGYVTRCALFAFWALIGFVAALAQFRLLRFDAYLDSYIYSGEQAPFFPALLIVYIVGIWLFPVFYQLHKRKFRLVKTQVKPEPTNEITRPSPKTNQLRWSAWAFFVVGFAISIWIYKTTFPLIVPALLASLALMSFGIGTRLEIDNQKSKSWTQTRFKIERKSFPTPPVILKLRLARLALWAGFVICTLVTYVQNYWSGLLPDIILMSTLSVACLGGAIWLETYVGNTNFALARRIATQSAGVLGIVWSLCFIIGSIGLWPLRAELNAQWERRLNMSEFEWMKEVTEKNRQKYFDTSGG